MPPSKPAPDFGALLIVAGAVVFWVVAYLLIIRRGVKDQSYGLPLSVLCVNIPWEVFYGFCVDTSALAKAAAIIYLVPDLGVLWICLKHGPEDFDSPLIKQHFRTIAAGGMAVGTFAIWGFHVGFNDHFGATTATFTTLISVIMILAMLFRRNSVRGQSFYIGLFILLGNACGWNQTLLAQRDLQPNIPVLWVHVSYATILFAGVIYLAVYTYVARRDGINPWTRW